MWVIKGLESSKHHYCPFVWGRNYGLPDDRIKEGGYWLSPIAFPYDRHSMLKGLILCPDIRLVPDMTLTLKKGSSVHIPQCGHVLLWLCYKG